MVSWDSTQYLLFKNERTQPAIDLAARIPLEAPARIVDIGCGPGNSTTVLARRFPHAEILGIDSSAGMIAAARENCPALAFDVCDAATDLPSLGGDFDVVFSNACIQWVPDHRKLLREMLALLRPGGVLAVQTPMYQRVPIQQILQEVTASARWQPRCALPRLFHNLTQSEYFDLLSELSAGLSLWETIYVHRLASHRAIIEWYRGTGMRPFLDVLSEGERVEFVEDVYTQVVTRYPVQRNGEVLFRFPRFFFMAVK